MEVWTRKKNVSNLRHNTSIRDTRMGDEQCFKFSRGNVEALVLYQLLQPVDDEQLIIIINVANVAGVEPSVLGDCPLHRFRILVITCFRQDVTLQERIVLSDSNS